MSTPASTEGPSVNEQPKLQPVNYANLIAYVLNVAITYGVGASGIFPTNAELSEKYQTIVTPAGYAFAIWGIIFLSQAIWVVAQLLPHYRSDELVVKGVGYYYVAICIAQCAWTFFFATEMVIMSLVAMVSILIPLVLLMSNLSKMDAGGVARYWLLKFPFIIHGGWIWAATLVNANVVLVYLSTSVKVQVFAAWSSLATLAVVASIYSYQRNYVVPVVLAWASFAIRSELAYPKDAIRDTFAEATIQAIQKSSMAVSVAALLLAVGFAGYRQVKHSNEATADASAEYSALQ